MTERRRNHTPAAIHTSVTRILPRGAETIASPGRWEATDTREIDFEASSHSETRTNRENA